MRSKKVLLLVAVAAVALLLASGCATKKFVRQEISSSEAKTAQTMQTEHAKINNQINELSDLNKQLSSRLEQVSDRASAADAKAEEAKNIGMEAKNMADKANTEATQLRSAFENRNNYVVTDTKYVHFGFDKFNLTDESKATLDDVAKMIAGNKNAVLVLEGYTDYIGSAAYNYTLSDKRVKSVIRYLVGDKSVDLNRIYTIGLGETNPMADNKTPAGRKENRRVSIKIMAPR